MSTNQLEAHSERGHGFIALTILLTFGARFVLASWNSYWLDELYSVEIYVLQQDTVLDAIRHLAATSIHPPLYQSVLYFWVDLFGDSEVATRTLSNVCMTLGVFFTYRFADRSFGRFVANGAGLMLSLAYLVMYYGLETRSYGMTLMWSVLSTWAILMVLDRERGEDGKGSWLRSAFPALILCVANLGLMLTHYFNLFFWAAQALFVGAYFLVAGRRRMRGFLVAAALYFLQAAIFFLVWGRVTLASYADNTGRFATDQVTLTPIQILDSVTTRSFNFGPIGVWALLLLALALTWWFMNAWSSREESTARRSLEGMTYLATVTLIPPLLAYLTFQLVGAERLNARYVIYLIPGIVVLLMVAFDFLLQKLLQWSNVWFGRPHQPQQAGRSASYIIALILVFVVPGAIRAARSVKDDWRGTAQDIVAIVESDPSSDYLVFEPAFRTTPVFDYYLRRYSDEVRVTATIRRSAEERGSGYSFERLSDVIAESDFLIIPFVHHRTTNFPIALDRLKQLYEVEFWQIDDDNKGLVIFSVADSTSTDASSNSIGKALTAS